MIPASRFIVQSRWETEWLAARAGGVTATAVAECATPSGFEQHVAAWSAPAFTGNGYTDFGSWAERYVMDHAHRVYGILPNDWLIAGSESWHLGTPDGLDPEHARIAEAKTGGKIPGSVPRQHRDQCLWNMHITDTARCLYLFQLRAVADDGSFYLGLLDPITFWIERDQKRIDELCVVADRLMEVKSGKLRPVAV